MTNDNEAQMIHDQICAERHALELLEKEKRALQTKIDITKKRLADAKQAAMDYCEGNGIVDDEYFRIGKSESVSILDDAAIPMEYVRIKREADKAKIKAMRPDANWYTIETNKTLTVK